MTKVYSVPLVSAYKTPKADSSLFEQGTFICSIKKKKKEKKKAGRYIPAT